MLSFSILLVQTLIQILKSFGFGRIFCRCHTRLVMADRNQLKQVFFNITKNAVEAMQPGGALKIRSHADDDSVFLLFGDSGAGIKAEDLARLFEPYHTTKPGGHGLGLMIVQRIMREHGGQIGVESKEGRGTVVTLQFPRKDRRVRMLGN